MHVEDIYKAKALLKSSITMRLEMMMLDNGHTIGINQSLCLPKAELKTKKLNQTAALLSFGWVLTAALLSFGWVFDVQLDWPVNKSPSDEVYRVGDGGPDHAVVLHLSFKMNCRDFL